MKIVIVRYTGAGHEHGNPRNKQRGVGLLISPSMVLILSVIHTVLFSLPTYSNLLLHHNLILYLALAVTLS